MPVDTFVQDTFCVDEQGCDNQISYLITSTSLKPATGAPIAGAPQVGIPSPRPVTT